MKTNLYRASNLKSTIIFLAFGSQFLAPVKNCQLFITIIIIIIIHFFRRVFSECTEAVAISLIPHSYQFSWDLCF